MSPFKLPHYGLPAFPALALLVARVWDDCIDGAAGRASPRTLLVPILVVFAMPRSRRRPLGRGRLAVPDGRAANVDVATRNLAARGQAVAALPLERTLRC